MPLIYRNIVPNVPLWQEGNGKLVFRDNALSARAAMTYSIRIHGTVGMDGAIAEAGLQSAEVDMTLSSSMPDYGSGTVEEWGGHNVIVKTPASVSRWANFFYIGDTTTPVGGAVRQVKRYAESWGTVRAIVGTETYIVLPRSWYIGHTWDARLGDATWFASPMPVLCSDNVEDSRGTMVGGDEVFTLALCHKAMLADEAVTFYLQIGGVSIPDESIVVDPFSMEILTYTACRYDAEPWPSTDMRPGTDGISLSRVAPALEYENVGAVDLGIRLKVNYAS